MAHVITDAVSDSDLDVIAEACREMGLLTGGSALARSLPEIYGTGAQGLSQPATRPVGEGEIVLSGSCSAMTRCQVAAFAGSAEAFRLDPVALAEGGSGPAREWLAGLPVATRKIVYATAEPEDVRSAQTALGGARAGAIVEAALAELAQDARDLGHHRFVVAGGETSGAVATALGVRKFDIGREIAPGVPWGYAESGGREIALTLKSGNFGAPGFFADALAMLERP